MSSALNIEIVIPQLAEKGGLDRIINDFAEYVSAKNDMELCIVQLVDTGLVWWSETCSVISLCKAADNPSFMDTAEAYASYLESAPEKPDVILATGWPVTITIVREALRQTGLKILLIGYPHMTLQEGEETGVGGVSCLNDADAVFAISKQIENEILDSALPIRFLREDNGIRFPEEPVGRDNVQKKKKLLYIGRLVSGKNLSMVYRAIANAKDDWSLTVVGQGETEKEKQTADACGVSDRVEFLGYRSDPYENSEDVMFCIMPSNYEGFCLVIPEALSRGIPVISTPVGCATEVIRPGENGYLVNVNDDGMLTEILNLISDGKLPIPDAKVCRESVLKFEMNHTFEKLYGDIKDLYEEYLG